jgi:hypothetical protein
MNYFTFTLIHKYYVFKAGLKTKAPIWRLITHDWTKFFPPELSRYNRQFFGKKIADVEDFMIAWNHHQNTNAHHWEYWIPRTGHNKAIPPYPDNTALPIPEPIVREMIADWLGASQSHGGGKLVDVNNWPWLEANRERIVYRIHPITRDRINMILKEVGRKESI